MGEQNVTANLDGGAGPPRTPHAFAKSKGDMDNDHIEVLGDQPRMSQKSIREFSERTPTVTYTQKRIGQVKSDRTQRSYGRG